jgi:GT2 family glycosyltransferase
MKLSIVIVNYKVKYFLEQCLLSVRRATAGIEAEVFVVDNDSQDDSLEYLRPRFPEVRFIANTDNVGFAKANNQAIRLSRGEYVLLLNPDTLVGEDVLRDALRFMDEHPDAGGLGVKMIDSRGRFLPESKRSKPTPWVSFCKVFGLSALFPESRLFGRYALGYLSKEETHVVDVLAGAFMLMRAEALQESGLLDERFFMYGEDIDLSYRLVDAGYRNYYLPVSILHYKGESTAKDSMRYVRVFYEAMDIFFKKHNAGASALYSFAIRFAIALRAGMAGAHRVGKWIGKPVRAIAGRRKREGILICAPEAASAEIRRRLAQHWQEPRFVTADVAPGETERIKRLIHDNHITNVVLSDASSSYGDMLSLMQRLEALDVSFFIHAAEAGTVVSSNQNLPAASR